MNDEAENDVATPLPVTVIIPALNEEANISDAIKSAHRAERVVVVDSGSLDGTERLARSLGAEVVQFHYRPEQGIKKKNWALANLDLTSQWTPILDADERITEDLWRKIALHLDDATAVGFALDREFVFMDRQLRCFRPNWNVRLFRTGEARYEDLGLNGLAGSGDNEIHEHMVVNGRVAYIKNAYMLHKDYRGIGPWIERHNKYAEWEAHLYARLLEEPMPTVRDLLGADPIERKRALRRVWARLPARPALRFLVWYFLRLGFLDGRAGYRFCRLMAWYESLILIRTEELRRKVAD